MCEQVSRANRVLLSLQVLLTVSSATVAVALSSAEAWGSLSLFFLLLGLALVSEVFRLDTKKLHISASFLALTLAMTLLGPTPAAVLGVSIQLVSAARRRDHWQPLMTNVSTYASFPLVGGVLFELLRGPALAASDGVVFVLLVLAVFMAMNFLNFLLIAADLALIEGQSMRDSISMIYIPIIPTELAAGILTAGVAITYSIHGIGVVGLLAVIGLIFQYLLKTALDSVKHKDQLEGRTRELASLQVGLLSTVLQTLSLRDKMTARHSAAVARYSREVARELGLSAREQEIIHTAGLLHDIGKFIFPDSILLAHSRLTEEDFAIVRKHPEQGAKLVARIEGYGPIAEIIHAHHERIDGHGYPSGLSAEEIPFASRIIAVADTYDVMTARDSYRHPVPPEEAMIELRRVAGKQLDAGIVETFIGLVERRNVTFRHADDADFESELNFESRVRDYAAPRPVAA